MEDRFKTGMKKPMTAFYNSDIFNYPDVCFSGDDFAVVQIHHFRSAIGQCCVPKQNRIVFRKHCIVTSVIIF